MPKTFNPVVISAVKLDLLTRAERDDISHFADESFTHNGWTYKSLVDDESDEARKITHYATSHAGTVELDFTSNHQMEKLVFEMLVEMGFPNRTDLAFASHFSLPAISPLNRFDVERIWLWRKVHSVC